MFHDTRDNLFDAQKKSQPRRIPEAAIIGRQTSARELPPGCVHHMGTISLLLSSFQVTTRYQMTMITAIMNRVGP